MQASSIGLSVLSAVLIVLLVMTNMSYSALKSDYSALEAEKAGLEKEYLEIKTRYSDLNSSYSTLVSNYSTLEKALASLKARYLELNDSYAKLLDNYTFLKMDYSKLQSDYQLLRGEYRELIEKHEDLKKDYADLKKKYENLAQGYQSVESGYSEIKKELEAISSRILLPNEFFPTILKQSLQADVERVVRGELGLRSDTPPELKARKVFEWITKNLQYLDDDYHQFIEDHELDMLRNFVSLPNETLARGGGDCEDLAVLAYAMLRSVLGESENIYLIGVSSGERGHVAVLYEYEGKFMIVDPAANYVTDAVAAMSFAMRKGSSYYTVWLTPMEMPIGHKHFLLENGFAAFTYLDPENSPAQASTTYRYLDPGGCVDKWLDYVASSLPTASVRLLANESMVKSFTSTSEFLSWLEAG